MLVQLAGALLFAVTDLLLDVGGHSMPWVGHSVNLVHDLLLIVSVAWVEVHHFEVVGVAWVVIVVVYVEEIVVVAVVWMPLDVMMILFVVVGLRYVLVTIWMIALRLPVPERHSVVTICWHWTIVVLGLHGQYMRHLRLALPRIVPSSSLLVGVVVAAVLLCWGLLYSPWME